MSLPGFLKPAGTPRPASVSSSSTRRWTGTCAWNGSVAWRPSRSSTSTGSFSEPGRGRVRGGPPPYRTGESKGRGARTAAPLLLSACLTGDGSGGEVAHHSCLGMKSTGTCNTLFVGPINRAVVSLSRVPSRRITMRTRCAPIRRRQCAYPLPIPLVPGLPRAQRDQARQRSPIRQGSQRRQKVPVATALRPVRGVRPKPRPTPTAIGTRSSCPFVPGRRTAPDGTRPGWGDVSAPCGPARLPHHRPHRAEIRPPRAGRADPSS